MELDIGFYSKSNNIVKVSVNLKVFVCFHGMGLKNELSLTLCKVQHVGLQDFVSLGALEARFVKQRLVNNLLLS